MPPKEAAPAGGGGGSKKIFIYELDGYLGKVLGEFAKYKGFAEGETPIISGSLIDPRNKPTWADEVIRKDDLLERVCTVIDKIKPILSLVDKNRILDERNAMLEAGERHRHAIIGRSSVITELLDRVLRVDDGEGGDFEEL